MYKSMGEGAKATHCGAIIKERIERMEKTAGGALAPDFTLPDLDGNPITMSEVKGKIKIIDFWASWDAKSVEAQDSLVPVLKELKKEKYKLKIMKKNLNKILKV